MTTVQFILHHCEKKESEDFKTWFLNNYEQLMRDEYRDLCICYIEHCNPDHQFQIVQKEFDQFYKEYFLD